MRAREKGGGIQIEILLVSERCRAKGGVVTNMGIGLAKPRMRLRAGMWCHWVESDHSDRGG